MAVILALDTSTEACSCALSVAGIIHESHAVVPRQHAQLILPMIRDLLSAHKLGFSELDAIAFGRGPGSFTGLRIAAGVTQGIAFAAGLPVIPVSTLAAVALDVFRTTGNRHVLACIDARIDEIYWAQFHFQQEQPALLAEEYLCKPEAMQWSGGTNAPLHAAGGNGLLYRERFPSQVREQLGVCLPELLPRAGHIATIAAALFGQGFSVTAEEARPVYLRDKVTHH